jgi:hypothetical protein
MGKKPPPKASTEFSRFKDLLRELVVVPKKEADEKMAAYDKRCAAERGEPESET